MIIKKYRVNNSKEAETVMRKELGPKAIILTTRYIKGQGMKGLFSSGKIEVTAAVEKADLESFQQREKEQQKDTSDNASASQIHVKPDLRNHRDVVDVKMLQSPSNHSSQWKERLQACSQGLVEQFKSDLSTQNFLRDSSSTFHQDNNTKPLSSLFPSPSASSFSPGRELTHLLRSKGLSSFLALSLENQVQSHFKGKTFSYPILERKEQLNFLKKLLAQLLSTKTIAISSSSPTIIAFLGPSGTGKTTAVTKLALDYHRQYGKRVKFISLQRNEETALDHPPFSSSIPAFSFSSMEQCHEMISQSYDDDILFIDTPGVNQYDKNSMTTLSNLFADFPQSHLLLTLSATTKDIDVYRSVSHFSSLPIHSIAFTKLDETLSLGILFNVSHSMKSAISYLFSTPSITEGVMTAAKHDIAHLFLTEHNETEWKTIRELAVR